MSERKKPLTNQRLFESGWWRRRPSSIGLKPTWMLGVFQLRLGSYPRYYPLMSCAWRGSAVVKTPRETASTSC